MRIPRRVGRWIGGAAGASALVLLAGGPTAAAVPIGRPMAGEMTYYNDVGYGACGTPIDASTQYLVAVSHQWWTAANPNNDDLCKGTFVQVTYNGRTLTLPVVDKCPVCDATHIDLSQPAFAEFAPLTVGVVTGISWQFTGSGGTPPPLPAPTGLRATGTTQTSVSLSWSGVSGAASYVVYRGGARVGSTAATSLTDTGLAAGTAYSYTVAAADSAGTVGAPSAAVPATTAGGGGGTGCPAPWNAATSYVPGDTAAYGGHRYTASYYSTGAVPGDPASWAVWADNGAC
ncbi:cysteine/serine endopeptidase inhibitor [Actinacidiphila sp. ITFR-21]|uniref:cysteine/serine endopeptidase inhibitor n=1 Tax=Actinacidiphila sp. ITFR-21 TaxID=3075199 RepID=UPI00288B392A|nr:cysteine/serine endopeptidase inhibitor [Streptomyces sp. ITFR-21]WNI18841.1 cysteine/serine endopeptidase inhibitor [Streptomyces sp. ITFR-21]